MMNKHLMKKYFQKTQKNMGLGLLKSVLTAVIVAGFVLYSVPVIADTIITDGGDFKDWIVFVNDGKYASTPTPTGGNLDDYLFLTGSGDSLNVERLAVYKTGVKYDPSTQGALSSISFQADVKGKSFEPSEVIFPPFDPIPSTPGTFGFLVIQEGIMYAKEAYFETDPDVWVQISAPNLASTSLTNQAETNPDFTASGGAIEFGVIVAQVFQNSPPSIDIGLDNYQVTVNPVPIPSAVFLLGSALIGIVGLRRRFVKS